ncbi:sugar ABC transporter substrate-binding protein [Clostridium beijerinckii]|uniref:Ribose transport system substrate-binding protein n=3 Tax=Clostridium beijerinckii TaxID=1520 RepID=A0A1B9BH78_CLOBE|nr:sugar ABC transporter substrate-binding protein [Clostridium beijerinckii]AQS06907.1 ABC transporter periplasmic-binding protein YtfQ precursor [Clostridium beijerinckii]MBA2883403.1 ribose transport system substrate-binding protein [Clostridium beijerinckii]MBA2898589.1 ribose transport system substrate-binding protein [Clostridium beijerinckii]MBA2907990.1 ribose transport system substrate-binding protein [Clostridium beijerinckii]MBA9013463.1 ribose transport system substrate-binding pro
MEILNFRLRKLSCIVLIILVGSILSACSQVGKVIVDTEPKEDRQKDYIEEVTTQTVTNEKSVDLAPLYDQVRNLKGQEALDFFESLKSKGLSDSDILEFFINLPLSDANKEITDIYKNEKFETYMSTYPTGKPYGDYKWTNGDGTKIKGAFSDLDLKLPFSNYVALKSGPVGDFNKKYRIGVAIHGFDQPWNVSLADAAQWEAERHPNVEVDVKDAQWDNDRMADIIDSFVLQKVDGILTWPMVESETTIAPVKRAIEAGIPVVSVDRMTGLEETTSRVTGNFPANGAQCGMYLIWKLAKEGSLNANVVLLRKPSGSTADANRTGHFLKVLSYFPDIHILKSYHDEDNTAEALANMQLALNEYPSIDVVFGTGDHEAIAAYDASKNANRLNSRKDAKKMMFLSIDDSKKAITSVKDGLFEVNTPYTPLISDIGMRTLLNIITKNGSMPHDIITPNIPMVTKDGDTIFGLKTQTPDQWYEYTFGAPIK